MDQRRGLAYYHAGRLRTRYDLPLICSFGDLLRVCRGEGIEVRLDPDLDAPGYCLAAFGRVLIVVRRRSPHVLAHECYHAIEADRAANGILISRGNEKHAQEFAEDLCGPLPGPPSLSMAPQPAAAWTYHPAEESLTAILDRWAEERDRGR